jgi:outer membrane receptor protein involved in Fe transport
MRFQRVLTLCLASLSSTLCFATVFGTVRGIVHDPRHHPLPGAQVILRAVASDWIRSEQTNDDGEFEIMAVPIGEYTVTVRETGFRSTEQRISVRSASAPILHFALKLAELKQTIEVSAAPDLINAESSTAESIIDRRQIERLPGAESTNSLAMITDLVPGSVIVHDQLHIRGGHQVSWLVDGVPVPNTSIAGNVAPQFDPKDVDYLEVQRGGYSSEYGERTYAVLNVVPRSGFERNNDAEIFASLGSYRQSDNQFSLGGHTDRFAYYTSLTGSRTDLGLQTPTPDILHDLSGSLGGFTSLIYNASPADQLRLVTAMRGDHYQIPNTPDQEALGIRDVQDERDAFVNFSWVRTLGTGRMLTLSPLYHRNRATFQGGPGDTPVIANDDRTSTYAGGQVDLSLLNRNHNLRAGFYGLAQHDNQIFGLKSTSGSLSDLEQSQKIAGNLEAAFVEDQFRLTSWFTLNGGIRLTRFSGLLTESAASPRLGVALRVPGLNWVLRGFYGRYYQPPPLSTISGPLMELAADEGFGFLPLRGERDEQKEVGLAIPFRGWAFDVDHYQTNARNYFDHDVLGNSNIFLPLTIAAARLRGWELTAQSPRLFRRVHAHVAYARQFARGEGAVTGGLTDFAPPEEGPFFLDHDQRHTLSLGFESDLPWKLWVSANLSYGSGFLNGDGPGHLPDHTTGDLSLGRQLGEHLSLRLSVLNLANRLYMLDNSNTFGGTHYSYPRQITASLRYRFHY